MQAEWDVAVLGAGPAGGEAARAAAQSGVQVLLIDEQARPGGQVWRAKDVLRPDVTASAEGRDGDRHREALASSDVTFLGAARLWQIEEHEGNWHLHVLVDGLSERHVARSVVLAPGAREFVQPFSGWTTPGVFGLAGATALMKSQQCAPGERVVVAGSGPLAIFAATEILRLGGSVAALVTPNARADWVRCLPALAANPAIAARGAGMLANLKRAGVPILWRHLVTGASGRAALERVQISPCDRDWIADGRVREIRADALCVGHGLLPNSDVAALAGLTLRYDQDSAAWHVPTGPHGETSLPGLFVCGDGATVRGAETARHKGRLVGAAAVLALTARHPAPKGKPRRHRSESLGQAMTGLSRPRRGLIRLTTEDTIVCRCETVTRGTLDAAIDAGALTLGALKSATRCGMGPCGGRYCMTATAHLLADRTGRSPETIPPPTPRPPLFPLPVSAIGTGFDYADLPIPAPAPL